MTNLIVPKRCTKCGGPGPFYKNSARKDGEDAHCKVCRDANNKKHKKAHNKAYKKAHPDKSRRYIRKFLYGITEEEYDRMLKKQGGRCAICKGTNNGKTLHIDHDHRTNKVRGLLCINCNHGVGKFRDDPNLMRSAIRYLER